VQSFVLKTFARWSDMDQNAHLANSAFLDIAVDARMSWFRDCGFEPGEFARRKIGPVVRRDEIEYFREVRMLDPLSVTLELAGMAQNGSRFRLANDFLNDAGQLCARLRTEGGWLDLATRRLAIPPPDLMAAMDRLARTSDFEVLPPSVRREA